jgi:hypothetical protein
VLPSVPTKIVLEFQLAPTLCMYPYLLRRNGSGKVMAALCKTCSDKLQMSCNHNEEQRSWDGTYNSVDIIYALSLGYKILKFYEMYQYDQSENVLAPFIKVLAKEKLKFTG